MPCHARPYRGGQEAEGSERTMWARAFVGVPVGRNKTGRVSRLGIH